MGESRTRPRRSSRRRFEPVVVRQRGGAELGQFHERALVHPAIEIGKVDAVALSFEDHPAAAINKAPGEPVEIGNEECHMMEAGALALEELHVRSHSGNGLNQFQLQFSVLAVMAQRQLDSEFGRHAVYLYIHGRSEVEVGHPQSI
jgi:hypothetical protein